MWESDIFGDIIYWDWNHYRALHFQNQLQDSWVWSHYSNGQRGSGQGQMIPVSETIICSYIVSYNHIETILCITVSCDVYWGGSHKHGITHLRSLSIWAYYMFVGSQKHKFLTGIHFCWRKYVKLQNSWK